MQSLLDLRLKVPLTSDEIDSLLVNAQRGDKEAADKLIRNYISMINFLVNRYSKGNRALRQEIEMSALEGAFLAIKYYRPRAKLSTYISCYVMGYILNTIKQFSKREKYKTLNDGMSEKKKLRTEVDLSGLNEREISILKMRFEESMTLHEIGEVLGCSRQNVKQALDKILNRMITENC